MMPAVSELIETIAKGDSSSWDIADHVAALPQRHEEGYVPLREVADAIYQELGVEWSPNTLAWYGATARAFPHDTRVSSVAFTVHRELRACPDKLIRWAAKNPGKRLSVETARNMRGGMSAHKAAKEVWRTRFETALRTLDNLAENDPAFAVDMVEQLARNWKARFPKAVEKARGLRVV